RLPRGELYRWHRLLSGFRVAGGARVYYWPAGNIRINYILRFVIPVANSLLDFLAFYVFPKYLDRPRGIFELLGYIFLLPKDLFRKLDVPAVYHQRLMFSSCKGFEGVCHGLKLVWLYVCKLLYGVWV